MVLRIAFNTICGAGFLAAVLFLVRPDWLRRYERHLRPHALEFEHARRNPQQVIALVIIAGVALSMLIGSLSH
jgi:hypothetical protein